MPIYRDSLKLGNDNEENVMLYVFDFSNAKDFTNRQMICVEPCITVGTQPLENSDSNKYNRNIFKPGNVFEGYYVKTKGPYDYCYKIWTRRHLPFAPLNAALPGRDQLNDSILLEINGEFASLACGQHLSYCKTSLLKHIGYAMDIKLPAIGPKVYLKLTKENRPPEIPYAAFEALPIPQISANQQESVTVTKEEIVIEEDKNDLIEKFHELKIEE